MRKYYSILACFIILAAVLTYRIISITPEKPLNVTRWDAFGYYMYLPAIVIYQDYKQLNWLDSIDKKYALTGGDGWQAIKLDNGNYTYKYLAGVAVMQLPLFLAGHALALNSSYPADGFSPPYQYALSFGVIIYCFLALLLLRKILLRYFEDASVAVALILLTLASNFLEYAGYGNGLSHAYIFPLYVLVLYVTMRWHERPAPLWAAATGFIVGLATMSRPTEAIMLFIPLLWGIHTKEAARAKWRQVSEHKAHIILAVAGGLAGILPQLVYWKLTTGSFIYDVGSKWVFLDPWFRVLVGWEKGWFIYTPVALLFIAGMFLIRRFPFRYSVVVFCLLNIWIIIAWDEWRYGGTYSTRALVQSYPVFALPLTAFVEKFWRSRWMPLAALVGVYLTGVNIFQTYQYNKTILHFDDMNRLYYSRIYLNPDPSPLDMSLLDTDEVLDKERGYERTVLLDQDSVVSLLNRPGDSTTLFSATLQPASGWKESWMKIEARIKAPGHLWGAYLNLRAAKGDTVKHKRIRLFSPLSKDEALNDYSFFVKLPHSGQQTSVQVFLKSHAEFEGALHQLRITMLYR